MMEVKNFTIGYSEGAVLENISFALEPSSITALVGHNGSGKTTLLQAMAGVAKPWAGEVLHDGKPVFARGKERAEIFYVPDDPYVFPYASVGRMSEHYRSFYPNFDTGLLDKLLGLISIRRDSQIGKLSKGMKRQAAIMLGLAARPKVLMFDELFDGLDPMIRGLVRQLMLELIAQSDTAVMISSHNLKELHELCDSVIILKNRSIVYQSAMDEIGKEWLIYNVTFPQAVSAEALKPLGCRNLAISGRRAVFISHAGREDALRLLEQELQAEKVEVKNLTLEELFLQEMEVETHDFQGWFGR
ncbi:MAG: ABC transporter ATP-binding protein [Clostridiales bacterium]|nr:ABC transporter ATP-binding protein [Clostridiales bacterium]